MKALIAIIFATSLLVSCSPKRYETISETTVSDTTVTSDSVAAVCDILSKINISVNDLTKDTFKFSKGNVWLDIKPLSQDTNTIVDSIQVSTGCDTIYINKRDTLIETETKTIVEDKTKEDSWSWWQIALALILATATGITLGKLIL